jgi:hypothetical protein
MSAKKWIQKIISANWQFHWWDSPLSEIRWLAYFVSISTIAYAFYRIFESATGCGWDCSNFKGRLYFTGFYLALIILSSGFYRYYNRFRKGTFLFKVANDGSNIRSNFAYDEIWVLSRERYKEAKNKIKRPYKAHFYSKELSDMEFVPFEVNHRDVAIRRIEEGYIPFVKREKDFKKDPKDEPTEEEMIMYTKQEIINRRADIFIEIKLYKNNGKRNHESDNFVERRRNYIDTGPD